MTGNGPPVRRNELLFDNSLKYEGLGIARWMEKSYDKDYEIRAEVFMPASEYKQSPSPARRRRRITG
jgi:hypothetical protein